MELNEFLVFLQNELEIMDTVDDVIEAFKVSNGHFFIQYTIVLHRCRGSENMSSILQLEGFIMKVDPLNESSN